MNQRDPVSQANQSKNPGTPVSASASSRAPGAMKSAMSRAAEKPALSQAAATPPSFSPSRARHGAPRSPLPRGIATPLEPRITVRTANLQRKVKPKGLQRLAYELQRNGWTIVRAAVAVVGVLTILAGVKAMRQVSLEKGRSNALSAGHVRPGRPVPSSSAKLTPGGPAIADESEFADTDEGEEDPEETGTSPTVDRPVAGGAQRVPAVGANHANPPAPPGLSTSSATPNRGALAPRPTRGTTLGSTASQRMGTTAGETVNSEPFKRTF